MDRDPRLDVRLTETSASDRRWYRSAGPCLLTATALLTGAAALPGQPALSEAGGSDSATLSFEPYILETRLHGEIAAEFGRLQVPENRRPPGSRQLELALVRLTATPESARTVGEPVPIVYLAGGPGGSGIQAGTGSRYRLFDALRTSGDVILFDQRGTGDSTPIEPDECELEAHYPLDRPLELEPYLLMVEASAAACALFWAEQGVDLAAYTTIDSVADLEALRIGLGAQQLDLLGISYGTHLALAYIRHHPERVRRVVLAGVEGPDHTVKLPSQFDAQLRKLQVLLGEGPDQREGAVGIRTAIERVRLRLERAPAEVRIRHLEGPDSETTMRIGWRDVAAITIRLLQDPESMLQIPELFRRLDAGDFTDIAGAVELLRGIGGLEAMPEAMDAASGISESRLERLRHEDRTTLLGSGVLLANVATARGLGVPDLGAQFRTPVASDVEALFISGSLDGRTPATNALEVGSGFPRSMQLIVRNGGHGNDLLVATPELEDAIVDFFIDATAPSQPIELPTPDGSTARVRAPLPPAEAQRFVGEYERRDREIWRIHHHMTIESLDGAGGVQVANAVLQIRWAGNGFPFHPVSESVFYIDFPWFIDDDFRFEFDDSGAVTHLTFVSSDGEPVRMPKVH